jgi:CBS domain-containing protein
MKQKTIGEVMNPVRYTIGPRSSVDEARSEMRSGGVRHLPVVDSKGFVIGIISEGDINVTSRFPGSRKCLVLDAMTPDPFVVKRDRPLMDVIGEMGSYKYGSTIVIDDLGRPTGIFTLVDALVVLQNYIRKSEPDIDSYQLT